MIDTFTTERFAATVEQSGLAVSQNVVQGEVVFYLQPKGNELGRLVVRSSIDPRTNTSADVGADSIRLWAEVFRPAGKGDVYHWEPIGSKTDAYTTRVPGWEARLLGKIAELKVRLPNDDNFRCPQCNEVQFVGVSGITARNPNRPFASCRKHDWFTFLDKGNGKLKSSAPKPPEATDFASAFASAAPTAPAKMDDLPDEPAEPIAKLATKPVFRGEPDAEQRAFIEAPIRESLIVNAGAGSGKTFSAVLRVKHLVDSGIPLERILFVTFGKTASQEIENRLMQVCPGKASVSTIHAHCFRAMKARGDKRSVVKYWDCRKLSDQLAESIWPDARDRPSFGELQSVIATAKFEGFAIGEDASFFASFGPYKWDLMTFRKNFDQQMFASKWCTFADMMFEYERALRTDPSYLASERGRFDHVIVDEAQDTGKQAMRILMALAGGDVYGPKLEMEAVDQSDYIPRPPMTEGSGITLVGDPDQLLYRWAGAWPESMMGAAEDYFSVRRFNIGTNYRSVSEVVNRAARVIRNNYEPHGPYSGELLKSIRPNREEAGQIIKAALESATEEGAWVCEQIQANATPPGDVFVIARTRAQLAYVEAAMSASGIPCVNITGGSFWSLAHVRKAVSYLRVALDESNVPAWQDVYNVPSEHMTNRRGDAITTRYLGAEFLKECPTLEEARRRWSRLDMKLGRWGDGITDALNMVDDIRVKPTTGDKMAFICRQMKTWIRNRDGDGDEGNSRFDDLDIVEAAAREQGEKFLAYVDECLEAAERVKNRDWNGVVVLSTIHRLKGLERPVVFVVGCCEGFKYNKVTELEEPRGLLPHTFSLMPPPQNGVLALNTQSSVEDERCLFYVACTRARDSLYLSYPAEYNGATMGPSRFLLEMYE